MLTLALLATAVHAQTPTSLPYTEVLGDLNTTGCDAAWYGGVCEDGWLAVGENDSVRMVTMEVDTSRHVIMIAPGTTMPNSVKRSFDVAALSWVRFAAAVAPVDGTATFGMRVTFRDANGVVLDTELTSATLDGETQIITRDLEVPSGSATAVLTYAAINGSSSGTRVAVFGHVNDPCQGCNVPPPDWTPGDFFPPDPPEGDPEPDCPESEGACDCDISCPEGTTKFHDCSADSNCVYVNICECQDDVEETSGLLSSDSYSDI